MHRCLPNLLLCAVLLVLGCGEGRRGGGAGDALRGPEPDMVIAPGGDARVPDGNDASHPGPDAGPPTADATTLTPDAVRPPTDAAATPHFDAAEPTPDAASPHFDAAEPAPDAAPAPDDASAPRPDGALVLDAALAVLDAALAVPDAALAVPDASPAPSDAARPPADAVEPSPDAAPCAPTDCDTLGLTCGVADDGCGQTLDCGPCPPPPAPDPFELDPRRPAALDDLARAVHSGPDAVEVGVEAGALRPGAIAWLRGRVVERDGGPLAGVTVRVFGRPALGRTTTRVDGTFDLIVDGPVRHRLTFELDDFLPAERAVSVRRGESRVLDDVALLAVSPHPENPVALGPGTPWQVAAGALESDADGTRRAALFLPPDTGARLLLADGVSQPVDALTLRLAEYTVGAGGPFAMPAELPPASGYTYAVEITADEALAAGARSVALDTPAWLYVENFVGFPVGGPVPAGYYDRDAGAWLPSDDGRVIAVLGVESGLAEVDVDGTGRPADALQRGAIGLTEGERALLAERYAPGVSLWRVPITHFTPWDCNWPYGPPEDAEWPPVDLLDESSLAETDPDCDRQVDGSIVHCQSGTLTKTLGIPGTPFELVHRSVRAPGYRASRRLDLHLGDGSDPASLRRVEVSVDIAGRRLGGVYPPGTRRAVIDWDGRDAFGRDVPGPIEATIRVRRVYPVVYLEPGAWGRAFGRLGTAPIDGDRASSEIALERYASARMGGLTSSPGDLGGFALSAIASRAADGRLYRAGAGGAAGFTREALVTDGPNEVRLISDLLALPDGGLLVALPEFNLVEHWSEDGQRTPFAGAGRGGDGGLASEAALSGPGALALGPDGSIYIGEGCRVRRVDAAGLISTFAGNGTCGFAGHGGPAEAAHLWPVSSLAADPGGRVFISQYGVDATWQSRIQMVDVDGVIVTLAGGLADDEEALDASGRFAWEMPLVFPDDLAVGPDGLYFTEGNALRQTPFSLFQQGKRHRIRRIDGQGRISTIAGRGPPGTSPEGATALEAGLHDPTALAFSPDGRLHFATTLDDGDRARQVVRTLDVHGRVRAVVGATGPGEGAEAGPVRRPDDVQIESLTTVEFDADGTLWLAAYPRLLALGPDFPGDTAVASVDGALVVFDAQGRHAATLDPLTGAPRLETRFDPAGRLAALIDADGRLTRLERGSEGELTGIVAPDGQRTVIALDAAGRIESLAAPGGRRVDLRWLDGDLLASATDAAGMTTRYTYDALGRLASTADPAGGGWQLAWPAEAGAQVGEWTSALGRSTRSTRRYRDDGTREDVERGPDGLTDVGRRFPDGTRETRFADGTGLRVAPKLDPVDPAGGESFAGRVVLTLPDGRAVERLSERMAVFSRPGDPTGLVETIETVTVAGRRTTATWEAESRTATRVTAAGRVETLTLDESGRVVSTTSGALAPVAIRYDDEGRLVEAGTEDRRVTYRYDARDRLVEQRDVAGHVERRTYDDADRPVTVTVSGPDEASATVSLAFGRTGLPTEVTPPGRPAHRLAHDPRGRFAGRTPPALPDDPSPDGVRLAYDRDGAVVSVAENGETATTLTYDEAGRPVRATLARGEAVFAYDPATGALSRATSADGYTTVLERNGPLVRARELYRPDGARVARVEVDTDVEGGLRPSAVRLTDAAGRVSEVRPRFDADGLLVGAGPLELDRDGPDGIGLPASLRVGGLVVQHTYDAHGHPAQMTVTHDGAEIWTVETTRDAIGRIASQRERVLGEARVVAYAYDGLGRLASVVSAQGPPASWLYDGNGVRLVAAGDPAGDVLTRHDARDRLLAQGDIEFEHDAAGRRTARLDSAGEALSYTYDRTGELLGVTGAAAGDVTYAYDAAGRRVERRVAGVVTDRFVYGAGGVPLARLDADGRLVQRFIGGSRAHVPDLMLMGERRLALLTDHRGSVRLVVDADTGEVAQRLDYDAWGRVLTDTQPGFQPFGFAGGLYDPATGLVQMGGRTYDPETGRFLTPDRAGFGGGDPNLYAYAGNDPVNRIDPSGYAWEEDVASFASGLGNVLSFGLGGWLADELGVDDLVERCSRAYGTGELTGAVIDIALPAGKFKALGEGWRLGRGVERGVEVVGKGGVQSNRLAGQVGEQFLARTFGGRSQVTMETSIGRRVIDNLTEGVARESKVGRTALTRTVRNQIAKDTELLDSGRVAGVEWHFFPGQTGVGPTAPLRTALEQAGIGVVLH